MRISDWSSDVCSSDLIEVAHHRAAVQRGIFGQQRARAAGADLAGAQRAQRLQVGACDSRMADVADDQDLERGEIRALRLAQGQHVEQALGGMRVAAVTGVEQRGVLPGRRSEEHTSELQSLMRISYAVFCLKKHNP